MNKKNYFLMILFAVFFVAVFSYGVAADTITIATASDALTLDPIMLSETPTIAVQPNVFDSLVYLDVNMDVYASLVSTWEIDVYTTWLFNLRKGVTFHNGDDFDAEYVKF